MALYTYWPIKNPNDEKQYTRYLKTAHFLMTISQDRPTWLHDTVNLWVPTFKRHLKIRLFANQCYRLYTRNAVDASVWAPVRNIVFNCFYVPRTQTCRSAFFKLFWPRIPLFNSKQCRVPPLIWASPDLFYTSGNHTNTPFSASFSKESWHSDV